MSTSAEPNPPSPSADPSGPLTVNAGGFTLRVPGDWTVLAGESERIPLTAVGPGVDGFAPTLVLTTEAVAHDDLVRWSANSVAGLRATLASYQLLDVTAAVVAGSAAVLRLAAYALDDEPLTNLQWAWLENGTGSTLTATCRTSSVTALADVFADAAHSLEAEVAE